jgi:DNA-binding CsgD family transcriptional regulator
MSYLTSPSESAFPQLTTTSEWSGLAPPSSLECWGEIDGFSRMIVTAERVYVDGDSRAREALASRRDLRLNSKHLEMVDAAAMAELKHLVRVEPGETRTAVVRRREQGGHLLMRAAQLSSQAGTSLIGIAFRVADDLFSAEWPDLAPVFGFTAAEAKIVELLLQGLGAELIASKQKVSINTVRTHISHVYEKLGIACREELWRRLAPYRLN